MTDFLRTRLALKRFDDERAARLNNWAAVVDQATLATAEKADKDAEDRVRVAFALDTAAFNPPERAQLIRADDEDFRRIVFGGR